MTRCHRVSERYHPLTKVCLNGEVQLETGVGWKDLCDTRATPGNKLLVLLVIVTYSHYSGMRHDAGDLNQCDCEYHYNVPL